MHCSIITASATSTVLSSLASPGYFIITLSAGTAEVVEVTGAADVVVVVVVVVVVAVVVTVTACQF